MNITLSRFNQNLKLFRLLFGFMVLSFLSAFSGMAQVVRMPNPADSTTHLAKAIGINWFDPGRWFDATAYKRKCAAQAAASEPLREQIISYAMNFLGRPYRSSGKTPRAGFDCSGFTGFIFKNFGMKLKSSSTAQATEGKKVTRGEAKTGDLAFFGKKDRKGRCYVNHAAIVISKPGEPLAIIHSASNKGIVITKVEESRYWRNALLFVRSVL